MKRVSIIIFLTAFSLAACQKEFRLADSSQDGPLRTFILDGSEALTKMAVGSYNPGGTPALWEDGDEIILRKVTDGTAIAQAAVESDSVKYGRFTISTTAASGTCFRVLYPSSAEYGRGVLNTKQTIKSTKEGTLKYTHAYSEPLILADESEKYQFDLKHALAAVRLSFKADPTGELGFPSGNQGYVTSIKIRTVDSPLSGDYTVDYATGTVTPGTSTRDYVELSRGAGFNTSGLSYAYCTTFPTNGKKDIEVRLHIVHDGDSWDVPVLFKGEIKAGKLNIFDLGAVSLNPEYLSTSKDYYARWLSGQDIMIGDLTVNKTKFPTARLLKADELSESILNEGGLIFIDDKTAATTFVKEPSTGQMLNLTQKAETVIIGRWKDAGSQPDLRLKEMRVSHNDLALLNVKITSMRKSGGNVFGMNGSTCTNFTQLRVVDCYIDAKITQNVVDPKAEKNGYAMKTVYFDNCIIDMPRNTELGKSSNCAFLLTRSTAADSTGGPAQNVIVRNSVLFTSENIQYSSQPVYIIYLYGKNTANTNYLFENNSIVNFQNNYGAFYFKTSKAGSLTVRKNLQFVNGAAAESNDNIMTRNDSASPGNTFGSTPLIECNFSCNSSSSRSARIFHSTYKFADGGNNLDSSIPSVKALDNVFTAANYSCGYFVIDQSKVTNGAGAYTEKKFIKQ